MVRKKGNAYWLGGNNAPAAKTTRLRLVCAVAWVVTLSRNVAQSTRECLTDTYRLHETLDTLAHCVYRVAVDMRALIMASATPALSVRGQSPSTPEGRGIRGLRCHAECPKVADTVIEAAFWMMVCSSGIRFGFSARGGGALPSTCWYRMVMELSPV